MCNWLRKLIGTVRHLSGDDAYERYLQHWRTHHAGEAAPLDRKAFFRTEQDRKWSGIRRCCDSMLIVAWIERSETRDFR